LIPISDYVIDFAVVEDKIWVVELNNPPPVAGTALFDWKDPTDRSIIEGTHSAISFEFRILQKMPENPLSDAQAFLDSEREKREKAAGSQSKRRLSF